MKDDKMRRFKIGDTTITVRTRWVPEPYPDLSWLEQDCFQRDHECTNPVWVQCGANQTHKWCDHCDPAPGPLCHWCNASGSSAPYYNMSTLERQASYGSTWELLGNIVDISARRGPWVAEVSDSLWGIESDADNSYLRTIESENRQEAFAQLRNRLAP